MFNLRLLFVLLLLSSSNTVFYVFTNDACTPCVNRYEKVRSLYPQIEFVKYDVSDQSNQKRFTAVIDTLDDVLLSLPIFGVFSGTKLRAVVAGEVSAESWESILREEKQGIPVYVGDGTGFAELKTVITAAEEAARLTAIFTGAEVSGLTRDFWSLLFPVSVAAVMDAVNPCAISVFLVMLTFLFYGSDRSVVLGTGLAFSGAVFATYLLMGLGMLRVFSSFSQLRYVAAAFALLLGVLSVSEFLTGARKHVPDAFAVRIDGYIRKVSNPRTGFVAGVVTGTLLLPCSSAPYFVALNLLSESATQFDGFLLLVLYNLIIVVPFLFITVCIHTMSAQTVDMRLWVSEKRRWINLLIGLGLIVLSLYSLYG